MMKQRWQVTKKTFTRFCAERKEETENPFYKTKCAKRSHHSYLALLLLGDIWGTALKQANICLKLHKKAGFNFRVEVLLLDVSKWPEQDSSEEQ